VGEADLIHLYLGRGIDFGRSVLAYHGESAVRVLRDRRSVADERQGPAFIDGCA
jgi:hypothetical protein